MSIVLDRTDPYGTLTHHQMMIDQEALRRTKQGQV